MPADNRILHNRASQFEIFALRMFQEAVCGLCGIGEHHVKASGNQVALNLCLIAIRHHVHAVRLPFCQRVALLHGTLFHAHGFAFQRFCGGQQAGAFTRNQLGVCRTAAR